MNLLVDQTLGTLVDDVLGYLRSFTKDQDVSTHLTTDMTPSDLTMNIASGRFVSRGRVQVNDEIVYVEEIDREKGIATIAPFGRGMDGTVPVAHKAGAMVTTSPLYPRHVVAKAINQVISGLSNTLYKIDQIQVPAKSIGFNYEVPEDTKSILNISFVAVPGAWKYPTFAKKWTFDQNVTDPLISKTGKAVFIYDVVSPLFLYTIVFGRYPKPLTSMDAPFSEANLPDTCYDVVVLGSTSRLLSVATAGLLQTQSVESAVLANTVDAAGSQAQSKYLYSLFQARLEEERMLLMSQASERVRYQR